MICQRLILIIDIIWWQWDFAVSDSIGDDAFCTFCNGNSNKSIDIQDRFHRKIPSQQWNDDSVTSNTRNINLINARSIKIEQFLILMVSFNCAMPAVVIHVIYCLYLVAFRLALLFLVSTRNKIHIV